MCWLAGTAKQIDLNSRYSAIKMFILCSLYSDSVLPVIDPSSAVDIYLLTLYILVVLSVFFGTQYEKTDIADEIIFFIYFKPVFFVILTNVVIYLFFFFAGVLFAIKKILFLFFWFVRGIFVF